jgi:hypothetical protein
VSLAFAVGNSNPSIIQVNCGGDPARKPKKEGEEREIKRRNLKHK